MKRKHRIHDVFEEMNREAMASARMVGWCLLGAACEALVLGILAGWALVWLWTL